MLALQQQIIMTLADQDRRTEVMIWAAAQGVDAVACADHDEAMVYLQQKKGIAVLICDGVKNAALPRAYQKLLLMAKTLETPLLMVIDSYDHADRAFNLGADEVVINYAPQAVFEKRIAGLLWQEELKWRQAYDVISGVYNKPFFYEKSVALLKEHINETYAMLGIDIERFKLVNELYGTQEGDNLLHYLGGKLRSFFGEEAVCGRITSDVFAVCVPYDDERLHDIARELLVCLKAYPINMELTLAMGVYRIVDIQMPISSMCDRAILALNTVKGNYQQHLAFYDDHMRENLLLEQQILNNMEIALQKGEFVVYYQPKCEMETGRIIGAEALVRWDSPERGLINPKEFVELFERNGFILEMDRYVWEQVCRDMSLWRLKGEPLLPISVNVSKLHLYDPRFTVKLQALVEKYQIPPALLELEITESACAQNVQQLQMVIEVLREQGFTILMDDFGSGYSSLNILQAINVDILKMDMQFLSGGQRGGNIVEAVVRMAKWLNLEVIAEGVQSREQVEFLLSIGCQYAQGYYYYEPMNKRDFEKLLLDKKQLKILEKDHDLSIVHFDELLHLDGFTERILGELLRNMIVCEYTKDNLDLLRATEGYYRLLGCDQTDSDPLCRHLQRWILPEDWQQVQRALSQAIEHMDQGADVVFRQIHSDGSLQWMYARVAFLAESGGRRMFCALLGDITSYAEGNIFLGKSEG